MSHRVRNAGWLFLLWAGWACQGPASPEAKLESAAVSTSASTSASKPARVVHETPAVIAAPQAPSVPTMEATTEAGAQPKRAQVRRAHRSDTPRLPGGSRRGVAALSLDPAPLDPNEPLLSLKEPAVRGPEVSWRARTPFVLGKLTIGERGSAPISWEVQRPRDAPRLTVGARPVRGGGLIAIQTAINP